MVEPLLEVLRGLPVSKWGIADIRGLHPLALTYPRAISLALAYDAAYVGYDEARYEHLLIEKRRELEQAIAPLLAFLREAEVEHYLVPHGGQDPDTLLGEFPHKLAATRAGLGWVGKNALLVTAEYGPRVRLLTVLVAADLPAAPPISESRCGECDACVAACPYGYITGAHWYPGIAREALFAPFACSATRESFRATLGHKHPCGLCLLACPVGR